MKEGNQGLSDIKDKQDIKVIVDEFYAQVRFDQILGPIFVGRIPAGDWSAHLERMYSFWNTVLFGKPDYRGNPFSKHATLRIHKEHFDQWVSLFSKTIDQFYAGPKSAEAKLRAQRMGDMFQAKLKHVRSSDNFRSIL